MANPKVMLVGYGNMGKFHARVLDKLGMLAAIVEPFEKNREIAAQSYDVPTFATIEGLKMKWMPQLLQCQHLFICKY